MSIDRWFRMTLACCLLLLALPAANMPRECPHCVSDYLTALDEHSISGYAEVQVHRYVAPTGKSPRYGVSNSYRATLLFERPNRFKLVLRPGKPDERRIVAVAGVLRWHDVATNTSGQSKTEDAVDPLAVALLGSAGELTRFAELTDLSTGKKQPLAGGRVAPRVYGTRVAEAIAWLAPQGELAGFETVLDDGGRVFVSILSFEANVETKPGDFEL